MIKLTDILSEKIKPKQKISKKEWSKIKKFNKHIGQDGTHYVTQLDKKLGTILVPVVVEEKLTESSDTFVNILNKFGFKKGARDWGGHQFFVHKSKDLYATYNPNGRSLVIEPKRGGKPVFDSDRSNFSIKALLSYLPVNLKALVAISLISDSYFSIFGMSIGFMSYIALSQIKVPVSLAISPACPF